MSMEREEKLTAGWNIVRYDGERLSELPVEDRVAAEYPLTLRVGGEEFATIVCTPADLEELVTGFLASEGVIRRAEDLESLQIDESKGIAYVRLKDNLAPRQADYARRFIGSCCGKSRQFYFKNDALTAKTVLSRMTVTPEDCLRLLEQLQEGSAVFRETGGVHNAALGSAGGSLVSRTDIGRHNALDKLFGWCLRRRVPLGDKLIAFSGRLSSEVVLKTAKIGVGLILSKSAPTDLGLELADDLGITVIGFVRGGTFNIYTHPERVAENTAGGSMQE
ncbi:formate dehydrogenase accessory sulfurtransferase FdhD [Paenibacillus sp. P25]|nr:formate dehydrogenase accessory sulfurtransferase FdhD [Paenibacillus sp. P25]